MKTTPKQFRFTWEDLDNLKYIKYYYACYNYNDTDVIRKLLREHRSLLESIAGDFSADSNLADFLLDLEEGQREALSDLETECAGAHINNTPSTKE